MSIYSVNNKAINIQFIAYFLCLTLSACATQWDNKLTVPFKNAPYKKQPSQALPSKAKKTPTIESPTAPRITTLPSISTSETNIKTAFPAATPVELNLPTEKLQVNVDALPLNRFIHLVLSDILKQSFFLDEDIAKRTDPVTLHITTPIKAKRLLGLIQQALSAFDVTLTETSEGLSVIPTSQLKTLPPHLLSQKSQLLTRLGRVMEIVPLTHAKPSEAYVFARHFLNTGKTAEVTVNTRLNALIIIGDSQRVQQYKQAVKLIDKPSAEGKYIRLIRPTYWNNDALLDVLQKTLRAQGIKVLSNQTTDLSSINLISVKKLNGIIIVSPHKDWLATALELFKKLDIPQAFGGEIKTYIYFVKNTRAKELGEIVNHIIHRTSTNSHTILDESSISSKKLRYSDQKQKTTSSTDTSKNKIPEEEQPINNDQAIIIDTQRNALIYVGTAQRYSELLPVIESLDILPRQVLIEVTIAEVQENNTLKSGVEWQINKLNIGAVAGSLGTGGLIGSGLGLGSLGGGLAYNVVDKAGPIRILVNALVEEGKAKILSSPRILALDNKMARIQVGNQILVVTGEVAKNTGVSENATGVVRSFEYVDTGIILEVTPSINEGGVVQLKLHQEVSLADLSKNANAPPIFKRLVDTTLVAKSGQSVVIAGLIDRSEGIDESKVPLLGDIPYLGYLFKTQKKTHNTTELVIIITPHILSDLDDSQKIMEEFQSFIWQ